MNNMTLEQAIEHAKEVAGSKCDECGKEHQQLAEWLAELVVSREKITRLETELKAEHQHRHSKRTRRIQGQNIPFR